MQVQRTRTPNFLHPTGSRPTVESRRSAAFKFGCSRCHAGSAQDARYPRAGCWKFRLAARYVIRARGSTQTAQVLPESKYRRVRRDSGGCRPQLGKCGEARVNAVANQDRPLLCALELPPFLTTEVLDGRKRGVGGNVSCEHPALDGGCRLLKTCAYTIPGGYTCTQSSRMRSAGARRCKGAARNAYT